MCPFHIESSLSLKQGLYGEIFVGTCGKVSNLQHCTMHLNRMAVVIVSTDLNSQSSEMVRSFGVASGPPPLFPPWTFLTLIHYWGDTVIKFVIYFGARFCLLASWMLWMSRGALLTPRLFCNLRECVAEQETGLEQMEIWPVLSNKGLLLGGHRIIKLAALDLERLERPSVMAQQRLFGT